jgi:hypothetical protein
MDLDNMELVEFFKTNNLCRLWNLTVRLPDCDAAFFFIINLHGTELKTCTTYTASSSYVVRNAKL